MRRLATCARRSRPTRRRRRGQPRLVAAGDDLGARRPGRRAGRRRGRARRRPRRSPPSLARRNDAAHAGHRRRRPQRRVRRVGARARRRRARPSGLAGIVDVDDTSLVARRAGRARSATTSRTSCAPSTASRSGTGRSRSTCRPSAAGSPAAAPASLDPLREDRGHGRRPRRRAGRRHGRSAPAARPRRPSAPTSTSCSSAPRARSASSPARGCACTRRPPHERRAAYGFASFADGLDACAASCGAAPRPAVLRLYDAIEADRTLPDRRPSRMLLVLDEGDPALVDATMRVVAEECATPAPSDRRRAASSTGWSTATTSPRSRR